MTFGVEVTGVNGLTTRVSENAVLGFVRKFTVTFTGGTVSIAIPKYVQGNLYAVSGGYTTVLMGRIIRAGTGTLIVTIYEFSPNMLSSPSPGFGLQVYNSNNQLTWDTRKSLRIIGKYNVGNNFPAGAALLHGNFQTDLKVSGGGGMYGDPVSFSFYFSCFAVSGGILRMSEAFIWNRTGVVPPEFAFSRNAPIIFAVDVSGL